MRPSTPDPRGASRRARRLSVLAASLGVVLLLAGAAVVAVAVRGQEHAPEPRPAGHLASRPDPHPTGAPHRGGRPGSGRPGDPPLGASPPTRISIPSIGVDSPVHPIGLSSDGTLAVPQPGPRLDQAAWFRNSPAPGRPGPSIIEGHVDTEAGPSVFFRLGDLGPGDLIRVRREDGVRLTFRVHAVRDYPKDEFPTSVVYGGDLSTPSLRLITCSDFNATTHHHEGNEVVFSRLVRTSA